MVVSLFAGAILGCGGGTAGDTEAGTGGTAETTEADAGTSTSTTSPASEAGVSTSVSDSSTTAPATTADATGDPSGTTAPSTSGGSGNGEGSGCCEAHADPQCDETAVSVCVCDQQPECCVFEWHEACAAAARGRCGATCEPDATSDSTAGDTTGSAEVCRETFNFEYDYQDAELTGSWTVTTSQSGEGMIVFIPDGASDGAATYTADVPCEDEWHIWVRAFDGGQDDSFFVLLDDEPNPAAIFAMDCTQVGGGYRWRELNEVNPGNNPCDFLADPWTANWSAGEHTIAFGFRESQAISRVVVTNDPNFFP